MAAAIRASGTQLVTVALRRFNRDRPADDLYGRSPAFRALRSCPTPRAPAMRRKPCARPCSDAEISRSPFVKLEIHPNPHHLMPDPIETFEAAGSW